MTNLADIAGDGAVHPILMGVPARWVSFTLIGAGTGRIGGSDTAVGKGIPLVASAAGATFVTPFLDGMARYQANEFYAYVPAGATLSVVFKEGPL